MDFFHKMIFFRNYSRSSFIKSSKLLQKLNQRFLQNYVEIFNFLLRRIFSDFRKSAPGISRRLLQEFPQGFYGSSRRIDFMNFLRDSSRKSCRQYSLDYILRVLTFQQKILYRYQQKVIQRFVQEFRLVPTYMYSHIYFSLSPSRILQGIKS